MDENDRDNQKEDLPSNDKPGDNAKRFKLSDAEVNFTEGSRNHSNIFDQDTASGSSDSADNVKFAHLAVAREVPSVCQSLRNYRNSHGSDDSGDDPMGPAEHPTREQDSEQRMEEDAEDNDNDNDWEDYEDEEDEDVLVGPTSGEDTDLFSDSSDDSTVIPETDNEPEMSDHPVLKKEQPKHWWSAIKEIDKRQLGYSANLQSRELFQRRCYGSLHCVKRLELMYKLEEHAGCVNSLNFHPDGSLLASGADDLKVVIWDWKLGKPLMKYKTKHRGNIFQSKFLHLSGDLHVASCARDGQVRLAQLNKDEGVRDARLLGTHKGPCHKLIVLPEQPQIILSAGEDGVVLSHDVRGPKSNKILTVKESSKTIALYSIHGHPLVSHEFCVSGRDSIVRAYDQRKTNEPIATYTPFTKAKSKFHNRHHVTCAVYNYNGSEILASYNDEDVYLFDAKETKPGKFIHKYQGHRNAATIKGVSFFGPKSEFVVSGSDCGHIYFWERNTEALVQWLLADDNGVVNSLEPHPQLPFICTSGLDWDVKVWVPSCEEEPKMDGLKKVLKKNFKSKSRMDGSEIHESQMLWMLWRHLRNSNRLRSPNMLNITGFLHPYSDSNSSESDSPSNSDGSDDDLDRPPNCNTS